MGKYSAAPVFWTPECKLSAGEFYPYTKTKNDFVLSGEGLALVDDPEFNASLLDYLRSNSFAHYLMLLVRAKDEPTKLVFRFTGGRDLFYFQLRWAPPGSFKHKPPPRPKPDGSTGVAVDYTFGPDSY